MSKQLVLGQTTFSPADYDLAAEAMAIFPEDSDCPELWIKDALRLFPEIRDAQRLATKANLLRMGAPL